MGDCLLWVVFRNRQIYIANILGYFCPRLRLRINFDKNVLDFVLGYFFHKLIWSPCSRHNCCCTLHKDILSAVQCGLTMSPTSAKSSRKNRLGCVTQMVIATASGTKDRGFESRQGVRSSYTAFVHNSICSVLGAKRLFGSDWIKTLNFHFKKFYYAGLLCRWHIFKPKIPIWVNFGGPWNGKCCYIYDHLEYFMAIWHNAWQFGKV
jgi:hypothetical protein